MQDSPTSESSTLNEQSYLRLTNIVTKFINFIWYFTICSLIFWCIFMVLNGLSIPEAPQDRHTDITFLLNFKVYPEPITSAENLGNMSELIKGEADIKLSNTQSYSAWFISNGIMMIMGVIGLFGLMYIRKLFINLNDKRPFADENANCIRKFGIVVVVWNIVYPILVYLGGMAILSDIGEHSEYIHLTPAVSTNLYGLFMGLSIIVLAQVIKEAAILQKEQSLTI
ncbi:DUF2975 domain-containing protein [Pleionea sediminis]|uniref:DUF2975 domain-containing protein n=1 Tax=Pleionea sediminis TaxID=2569479 RepID=UPI0011866E51|nr:DUF2975 domain-containing protein [Pleionea sediminis]